MKWPHVQIKQVAEVASGFGFPRKYQGKSNEEFPFFKVGDMNLPGNERCMTVTVNTISAETLKKLKAKAFPKGTIIFPKIGAAIATNKKRMLVRPSVVDNNIMGLIPNRHIDEWYLFYWMQHFDLRKVANIGPVPSMRKTEVESILIPLPPLSEQRRIVEILDQADALRKKRAEADAKAARILFALFIKSFGNPVTNPMGWQKVTLGSCCEIVTGNTPSTKKAEYYGKDILWARPADLDNQIIVTKTEKMLSATGGEVARIVPQNSVLVVCIGATLGKVALAGAKMAINQQINAALPSASLLPEFLYVQCALLADRFRAAATKSTLPILNKSRFSHEKVLLPPKERQEAFVRAARIVITSHDERVASRELLESLFQSLLHRAFTGDLTAKWREAHMKELLEEMEQQAKALDSQVPRDNAIAIRTRRGKRKAKG